MSLVSGKKDLDKIKLFEIMEKAKTAREDIDLIDAHRMIKNSVIVAVDKGGIIRGIAGEKELGYGFMLACTRFRSYLCNPWLFLILVGILIVFFFLNTLFFWQ